MSQLVFLFFSRIARLQSRRLLVVCPLFHLAVLPSCQSRLRRSPASFVGIGRSLACSLIGNRLYLRGWDRYRRASPPTNRPEKGVGRSGAYTVPPTWGIARRARRNFTVPCSNCSGTGCQRLAKGCILPASAHLASGVGLRVWTRPRVPRRRGEEAAYVVRPLVRRISDPLLGVVSDTGAALVRRYCRALDAPESRSPISSLARRGEIFWGR